MDGLSTAGSVVSLVAIAGQLIQSTQTLFEFWSSVKDVPARLQWLIEDLRCVEKALEHIQQQCARNPNMDGAENGCQALQRCVLYMNNLRSLVAPFHSRPEEHGKRRVWKSIKAEFNAKKVTLCRENLEAAKSLLLLTQTTLNRLVTGRDLDGSII